MKTAFTLIAVGSLSLTALAAPPAVLFHQHVHTGYVVKPLKAMGIEVDVCPRGELPARLASKRYNVVVVGVMDQAELDAVEAFIARGGGVLACNPECYPRTEDWTRTNEWLTRHGARPRWELLRERNEDNIVRDVMGCRLLWSDRVQPPLNEGVDGVLTLTWQSDTGCEPPMPFEIADAWQAAVLGAPTMHTEASKRNDIFLQPWMPAEPLSESPVLMAVRELNGGRLAVLAIRSHWLFHPPPNCPTAEAMLSAGAGGKPSGWLQVCANAFRWLAEPSLEAGLGGATTPAELLDPPVQVWEIVEEKDWSEAGMPEKDQLQTDGLIGARTALSSGSGSVADYVAAAKAAGLRFIVFLEDSMNMDQAAWDKLVAACTQATDADFAAVPGLTYEDAQGNHLYAFADNVQFPKDSMLLPDRRLATVQPMRSRAYFDYVNELMGQKIISGLWRHDENYLHFADYKLYNSFPIVSFVQGKQVDDGFEAYRHLLNVGGCQAPLAFEIMTSPDQVAARARDGWRVVAHRTPAELAEKWHSGAWSFSGSGSQYISNGPRILVWQSPNRLVDTHGEWWRPDLWQYRLYLRASSEAGLKEVRLYDAEWEVLRRWQPDGAGTFEQELVLANAQQLGLFLEVEDMDGKRAVSAEFWNRHLMMEEFICSDRCNILGNCRLRTRNGQQVWTQVSFKGNMGNTPSKGRLDMSVEPAVCLTRNAPTLPIDGRPMGFAGPRLTFNWQLPGEAPSYFAYGRTYIVSPEIAVGQADLFLAYDPAEQEAQATPLGHAYQQPQTGWGNAWGSWHRLIPTRKAEGWTRTYACNWLPDGFRIGRHETRLTLKDAVSLDPAKGLQVMYTGMKELVLRRGEEVLAGPDSATCSGDFSPGTFATIEHGGGSVVIAALDHSLTYTYSRGGTLSLSYKPEQLELKAGDEIRFTVGFAGAGAGTTTERMLDFARRFGIVAPGRLGIEAELTRGEQVGTILFWQLKAANGGITARIPQTPLPGYLPVSVEGLNNNWSAHLLDTAGDKPKHRALPLREGRAFALLDPDLADCNVFIGHPVLCDQPDVKLLVSWKEKGKWYVEAHNPTDRPLAATLRTDPAWTVFTLEQKTELAPGASRVWEVAEND